MGLLTRTDRGIYCEAGDFYIDPWRPVDRAVVTHAHSDHARWGSGHYLCASPGEGVLRSRLGSEARIQSLAYGEPVLRNGVRVSLHPAGHILGSAQVRVEHGGRVEVVSGDYKTEPDRTCALFEPVRCHRFVTESTFGLPIYRWPKDDVVFAEIHAWWRKNQAEGRASVLMGYALGKAQRALAGLDASIGPIFCHGAVHKLAELYRAQGVPLAPSRPVYEADRKSDWSQALIVAPPGAVGTPWIRRFGDHSTAFLSGWMAVRGARRRRAVDRGFVLSDHVDWPSLLAAVDATGAEEVWVTHGYAATVARVLCERGLDARPLETPFEGEMDAAEEPIGEEETT